jgi:hypothetical protein
VLTVYMISDNDVSESVSSSGSGCPSPVSASKTRRTTEATTAKGILVHNKKSTNTNRVSFVTQNPSSLLSPSFPSAKRFKKKQLPLPQQSDSDDHIPYYFQTGRQLTGFGVKSYLHEFYDDPEDPLPFQVRIARAYFSSRPSIPPSPSINIYNPYIIIRRLVFSWHVHFNGI